MEPERGRQSGVSKEVLPSQAQSREGQELASPGSCSAEERRTALDGLAPNALEVEPIAQELHRRGGERHVVLHATFAYDPELCLGRDEVAAPQSAELEAAQAAQKEQQER